MAARGPAVRREPAKGVGSSAVLSGPSHPCLEGHPAFGLPEHTKLLQHARLVPLLPTLDHPIPRHVVEDQSADPYSPPRWLDVAERSSMSTCGRPPRGYF